MPGKKLAPEVQAGFDQGVEIYDSIGDDAMAILQEEGIGLPRRPVGEDGNDIDVEIPTNLSEQGNDSLGKLMGDLTIMLEYINGRMHFYNMLLDKSKRKKKFVQARIRKEKVGNETEKSNAVLIDLRYIEADREESLLSSVVEVMRAVKESKDQAFAAVSRLVTLRMEGDNRSRRNRVSGGRRSSYQ